MKGFAACLRLVHFSYFPTFQTPRYFVERSSVFTTQRRFFLRLELSRGTTIAAEIGQAVVDLKLEVKR